MFRQMGRSIGSTMAIYVKSFARAQDTAASVVGRHIPALDGIRGAAILLVLIHHLAQSMQYEFGFKNPLQRATVFGWTGVELFFVLSGFLITGILYDSKGSGHYFKNFYLRRVLRIFPLYYGTLLLVLLLRAIWPQAGVYGNENPAWMWVYLTNIVIARKGLGAFGFVDHFWSLAIEEHFYVVWPLVVFLLSRRRLIRLTGVLFFLSLGLRIALVLGGTSPDAIYVLTPLRLDALSVGAFLALVVRRPEGLRQLARPVWLVGSVSGLGIIAVIIIRHTVYHADPVMQTLGYSLLAVFFGAVLILSLTSSLQQVFSSAILRWFGKYSYGMYVWHPIMFIFVFHTDLARTIRGGSGMVEMVVSVFLALGAMFAVTLLSWHLWESQFLKLKRHFK
jgi:peptidoglycan/LPS O-acetylase OafA/YrhL